MTEPQPKFLTIAEKREWLAGIFRDTSGEYTDADKFKALREETRLMELARLSTGKGAEMRPNYKKYINARPFSVNDRGDAIGVYNFLTDKFTPVTWQGSIEGAYERAVEECERLYAEWRKEPYRVYEDEEVCEVQKGLVTYSVFYKVKYGAPEAKAAAEVECARLNEEWRKEQE